MKFPIFDALMYVCNRVVAHIPSHCIRLGFYRRVMKFRIGEKSCIFLNAWFDTRGNLILGSNSVVNQFCRLDNRGGIAIGSNVSISADVTILTADHNIHSPQFDGRVAGVVIKDFVFIGTRAMVLPGVTIGYGAVVAAGSVVTSDVPDRVVVAGIPARVIGHRECAFEYIVDYQRPFM